jgi:hypothetical protein
VTRRLDDQQQRFAAQVEQDHRDWVIMWGYYSRLYWAFPRFNAPPGTVVAAPAPGELTEAMRRAEIAAALAPRFEAAPPSRPRRGEPPPGQRRGGRNPAPAAVAAGKPPAGDELKEPEASVG